MKTLHTFTSRSHRTWPVLGSLLLSILLLVLAVAGLARAAAPPDPADQLRAAWERARDAGYQFEARVEQTLFPLPVWSQWGHSEEQVNFYLEGELERLDQPSAPGFPPFRTRTRVWPEVGRPNPLVADAVAAVNPGAVEPMMEIVQEGDKATVRQAGQEARTVQIPTGLVAPQGDYLAYLEAARDVEPIPDCPLPDGACYRFRVDGPTFARVLRDRTERQYAADLPPNVHLAPSPLFQQMTGQGELWVDTDGFPVRQVLDLEFPQVSDDYGAKAHVVADFSPDKETRGRGDPETKKRGHAEFISPSPHLPIFAFALLLTYSLVRYRRRKRVYATIVLLVITSMLGGPLYSGWRMNRFFRMRTIEAAESGSNDERRETADEGPTTNGITDHAAGTGEPRDDTVQAFFRELERAMEPNGALPGHAVGEQPPGRDPRLAGLFRQTLGPEGARLMAQGARDELPPGGCYQGDLDSDGDGLCDGYETDLLGTDDTEADTDRDLITDTLEVEGFPYAGKTWYTNPLVADSNRDGLTDYAEWPEPVGEAPSWDPDGDNLPNVWDDDNDGDGVIDRLDISPWSYSAYIARGDRYSLDVDAEGQAAETLSLEFQVQPQDSTHLRYAMRTLDWPNYDDKGQIMDLDASVDDLTLIPMLEVLASAEPQNASEYAISVVKNPDNATKSRYPWKLYAPITVDDAEGRPAAFHAKMVFQGGATIQTQSRLVWLVQAKDDTQIKEKGVPGSQVIHIYDDDFRLAGLKVSRHGSTELALLGTPHEEDNGDVAMLLLALSQTFLLGREDLTLEEVERRFQSNDEQKRWGITTTVRVIRNAYPHMDAAIADTIANTAKTLLAEYNTSWRPALLVAYEDKVGFAGLDDLLPAGGGPQVAGTSASFDLDAATMMTLRGLKLNQYQYTTQGWVGMELGEMLADLDDRYGGDSDVTDELLRSIKLLWMAWVQGLANVVRAGAVKVSYPNILEDDVIVKEFRGWVHKLKGVVKKVIQPKLFWEKVQGGYGKLSKFIKDHPRWSTAIAITVIVLILVDLYFKGVGETMKHVIMGLGVAFAAYGLAEAAKKSGGFLNLIKGKAANLSKAVVILNVIILVVEVVLIWYAFFSATANVSGPAYYMALSLAIGMTILAVALFVLSFFGIGQVVSLLLAIADFIGSFFGVNVSNWIAGYIGKRYLTVKVITTLDPDSIDFKSKEATWQNPAAGAVPGNELTLRAELKGMIVPKGGGSLEGGGSLDDAFNSNLQGSMVATGTNDVFAHADGNIPTKHKTSTGAEFVNETNAYFKPQRPGVDLPADLAVQVNYTILYKLGHGCELGYCAWWEDAKKDSGSATSDPSTIYLDVLPSTVSGLWTWSALTNHDPDGDGLTTTAEQALLTDPNNTDTDGDGLDDGTEVRLAREGRGTDPRLADSDNDGLNDREEIVLGTRADNPDTDGDGLSDGGERAGYMMDFYGLYPDAWAWPDPFKADADRDGLTDSQEFALKTNPNAGAYDLNAWIYATAGYVQPGATVTVSVVGVNFTGRTDIKPHIQVRLPPTITPTEFNVSGRVRGDGEYSWSWTPMVVEPDGWRHWTIMAPVAIAPGAMFTVTAVGRLDATLAHGTVVTFTSSLTYAKSPTETFWAGDMGRVVVDRIRPTSAILDPTDGAILRGQAYVVGGTAADPDGRVQQVEVSADGGTLRRAQGGAWGEAQGQGAWNWTWELPADGDYTLRSRATDQAGWQEDPVTSLVNVAVDNTAPSTSMRLTHPGGEIHDGDTVRLEPTGSTWVITATGQVSDDTPAPRVSGVDTVSIQRDGRDQAVEMPPPAPGQRIADWQAVMRLPSGRPEGEHQLTTWAADQVRNVESPATLTFRVDTTPPTVGNLGSEPVLTPVSRQDLLHVTADDFGRYQPLPAHQPMRGNVDARSGRVGYRALNPADLDDGRLASGDFNGDDIPDLAVSAPGYQNNVGAVYLIFGKVGPWSSGHNLSEADAWLVGPVAGTRLGQSLANAGDLNGDGADELIIGAADGAYVSFGRDAGWRRGEVLDASDRLFPGRATLVSGGGDLDGDGDDDAVVAVGDTVYLVPGGSGRPLLGAPLGQLPGTVDSLAGHADAGLIAGSSDGNEAWLWIPVSVPSTLPRSPSAIIRAARGSKTPSSVGYAGDVNGDGLPDWLIGDGRVGTARVARLFAGRAWTGGVYDDVTDATAGFKFGTAGEPALLATGIGDVNADGYDDIVVGFGTTAWVMHGRSDPETWGLEYDLGAADATISHLKSAAGAGLNCDGSAEVTLLTDDGRISLFFGKAGNSCAVTPAGVEQVEFGLGAVTDPSAPLTATLPARWTSASPVGSSWQTLADVPEPVGGTGPRPSGGGNIAAWDGRIWAIVGNDTRSFYAYDPQTDTWTRKADLPEDVDESSSLAAGGDGYLYATGNDHAAPVGGGFYRYDPAADRWTRLADPPYYHFDGTALAGDGAGHVYMTCGGYRYFYRYDIGTDTWVARAHVPQPVGNSRALVWVNDALYLLPGYDSVYPEYDSRAFYRYDPALDAWTRLGNAPDRIGYGGSLAWNGGQYIYALRGRDTTDFYRYDLQTDTWAVLTSTPGAVYDGGDLAWLDGYLYAARGFYSQSFWRMPGTWHVTPPEDGVFRIYARATDAVGNVETDPARWAQSRWRTLPDVPGGVGDGGRLAVVGDRVYVATGNGRTGFYAFAPGPGTWQRLADTPRTIGLGSDLADAGDGRLYLLTPAKNFWRYDIATDAWTEMHTYPGGAGEATAVAGDGLGTLYVLNSNQSRAFYRYTPTSGWEQLADTPAAGRWGSALTVVRDPRRGVHIYALRGSDSADFWRYDPDLGVWEVLPDIPGSVGSGGALAWACTDPEHGEGECDGGDYIYAFRGQASRGFYRYHISEARWEILPDAPATVHEGGSLAWGHGGLYALRGRQWPGGPTPDFWRWDGLVIVDRTPPVVSLVAPADGATVTEGSTYLAATASDFGFRISDFGLATRGIHNSVSDGVTAVTFEVDGIVYEGQYDTGSGRWVAFVRLANGTHTVTATASDALGNVVTAPAAGFTVQVARGVPVIESPPPEAYVGASLPVTGYVPGGETTDHVALSINGAEVGEAGVQGDGTFSSVLDLSLPDGPITLTAQLKGELLDFSSVSNDIGPFAGGDRTITLQGDWDGDGKQDIAGWNSQAGAWDFRLSQGVSDNTLSFNRVRNDIAGFAGGDTGIMWLGDWDGDGRTDLAGWNGDAETWDTRLSHQLSTIDGAPYRRWQGSDPALQHAIGQQVDSDWQAGYDGDRACGSRDAMVYGPYVGLMPGAYRATFRLQTFEPPGGVWWFYDLADVDVTYDGGQHTLGSLSLKGTDIPRGWQEFQIDFTVDSAVEDVELRVWYVNGYGIPGACAESPSLMVDWVSLGGAIGFGQVSNNLGNWNSGKQNPMMFGDFDGNGTTDIAGWNPAGNEWDFRLSQGVSDGTLTFQKASNNLGAWNPGDGNAMIFGDFDGDGRGDVAGWNPPSQTWDFRVSQGVSGGSLTFHQVSNDLGNFAGGDAGQMMVADFDGDGDTDVAGWNSTLNDGQGGWDIQLSQVAQDSSLHFKGVSNYLGSFADPTSASRWVADFTGDDRAEIGQWPSGANSWDFRLNSGLVGRTPGSVRVTLDATPPTASFTSVADGSAITATGRITITGTAGDTASGLAQVRLSFDNTASWREVPVQDGSWQTPWDVPTLDGQTRHLVVEATDRAGWTTRQSIAVTVDNVLPGGADAVTFSVPVGQHIQAGTALQATWSAPSDGSGAVHTFAALDQITDTIPSHEVGGTSFSATFDRFGDYYFHLSVQDTAGNRRVAHYGPWHAWYLGSPPQPQYTIIVDGQIDLEHAEWLPEFERLGQDERSGRPQELFLSWDSDDVFLGWRGAHIGVDGDLVWLFDTVPGGSGQWTVGSGQPAVEGEETSDQGLRTKGFGLPFEADFYFIFRRQGSFGLFQWNGGGWAEVSDPAIEAASGLIGDVEARIPRSLLQVTGAVRMLALARRPDDGPVWAVLPDTNPLEGPWTVPYSWDSWVCEAGDIAQASVLQQVPCPLPAPGQPDAGLTWLRLTSPQPSGLYLPVNGTITYALVAGNATDQPADETRLTLTGDGVVFEAFSGPGTCSDCPAGGDTWTVDLGTLPPQDQVAIAVTARTLDTNGATVPVTTTAHLTALLPDADPGDNVRSLTHLVDGTPPTVAFVAPLDGDTILPGPQTVVGTAQAGRGDAIVGVEVSTDGVTWRAAQGRAVWTAQVDVPTEGTLTVYVRAIDEPGNVGPPTAATFIADGVAPVATITPPEGVAGGESLLLTGTAFDLFPEEGVLEEVEVRVDDGYWIRADGLLRTDGDYDWHFRWSLPEDEEGVEHRIAVRAVDAAGSVSEPSAPVTVVVDTIAPTSEIAYPADGTWLEPGTTQVLVWGWSEDGVGVAQVRVSLDAGLTWADAVVADEEMGDGRWRMEDGTVLELPSAIRQQLSAIRHQPSARLWAFAGTLPEDEAAPLILARATDVAGNVERPGPAVQLHRVVSRLWLPLTMKNAAP